MIENIDISDHESRRQLIAAFRRIGGFRMKDILSGTGIQSNNLYAYIGRGQKTLSEPRQYDLLTYFGMRRDGTLARSLHTWEISGEDDLRSAALILKFNGSLKKAVVHPAVFSDELYPSSENDVDNLIGLYCEFTFVKNAKDLVCRVAMTMSMAVQNMDDLVNSTLELFLSVLDVAPDALIEAGPKLPVKNNEAREIWVWSGSRKLPTERYIRKPVKKNVVSFNALETNSKNRSDQVMSVFVEMLDRFKFLSDQNAALRGQRIYAKDKNLISRSENLLKVIEND